MLSYALYVLVCQVKLEGVCCDSFSNPVPEALGLILRRVANNSEKRFPGFTQNFRENYGIVAVNRIR